MAFQRDERDELVPSEPSEEALLGSLMHSEYQASVVIIAKILIRWFG